MQLSVERRLMELEIWSDIACPWCYVGKRRLEAALDSFDHAGDVNITWRSFELDPSAPPSREQENAAHLAEKYGRTLQEARGMLDSMTRTAATDGLDFRFDLARAGNTFDAHRLTHLAAAHGLQGAMKERLMRAYLTEGELVSDHDTLRRLALEVGLPVDAVDELLAGDAFSDEVRADEQTAGGLGINAVPFFVIDRAFGSSGAQPSEAMLAFLQHGWEARSPLVTTVPDGATCGPDGC